MVIVEHKTRQTTMLSAKSIKVTLVLSPAELLSLSAPDGKPRCLVRVDIAGGRTVVADLNAKSVRKAIATIGAAGPDNVAVILQGKLAADNTLTDAGLAVQVKVKAEAAAVEGH